MNTQNGMPTTELSTEEFLENLESCALCGTKLRFNHQTDYLTLQVHEEARCPDCGIKHKVNQFILQ